MEPETGQPYQPQPVPYQPMPPLRPGRPGPTTAAAVLGFVQAGLGIIGGFVGISAYSAAEAEDLADDAGAVLAVAVLQLVVCAAVIYASVRILRGQGLRVFQGSLSCMLVVCVFYEYVYLERLGEVPDDLPSYAERQVRQSFTGAILFPFVFAALAIVALCLANSRNSKRFLGESGA